MDLTLVEDIKNNDLSKKDMLSILYSEINKSNTIESITKAFDDLVDNGIPLIIENMFRIDTIIQNERTITAEDRSRKSFQLIIQFHSFKLKKPTYITYIHGKVNNLYPKHSRISGIPYAGEMTLCATLTLKSFNLKGSIDEKIFEIPSFPIGNLSIMVGSRNCHTYNCNKTTLREIGEDPSDMGGYFIAKGSEYLIDHYENIRYNDLHIHSHSKNGELIRGEFLSQAGSAFDNSSQLSIRLMANGQITLEINSVRFERVSLPFYIYYRIFGMTSDKDIVQTIVFDIDDQSSITKSLLLILEKAFHLADTASQPLIYELNREKLVQMVSERISKYVNKLALNTDNAIQFINEDLLGNANKPGGLDKVLLPHVGTTSDSRIEKLRFIGLLIRKSLLVHLGILQPTDRDNYCNKRIHGAGVSLAKTFKTQFNSIIIIPVKNAIKKNLRNNEWGAISDKLINDIFRHSIIPNDLSRAIEQSITSGSGTITIRKRTSQNRISSQIYERKNSTYNIGSLRTITAPNAGNASKQTERASMMRRVHPSGIGFICTSRSPDTGETVGMRKELTISSSITINHDSLSLKIHLSKDENVMMLNTINSVQIIRLKLSKIFVNGEWIGFCKKGYEFVDRYRKYRRSGVIVDRQTTITYNFITDEINFLLDTGRLMRPLLCVYNNISEYNQLLNDGLEKKSDTPFKFIQNILFTKKHVQDLIHNKLNIDDLEKMGIIEYITVEEHENCLIADNIDTLKENANNILLQYTHCDIEQTLLSFTAHIAPFANHTQPARITLETNQARQTCGWYNLNFPHRTDKNKSFQFVVESPMVQTLTQNFVSPNGINIIVAYTSYLGDNQEDSAILNQASVDRGMFSCAFFSFELAELEKNETFCTPNPLITKNIRPNANYAKLDNGFIRVGQIVRTDDVMVGRVAKIYKEKGSQDNKYEYNDRSLIYRKKEPALVEDVLFPRGVNDELVVIVKLRYERQLRVGDKLSSRSGNKCIVALMLPQSDMPFTETGLTPDIIINTHSIPTRMTIGQMIESRVGIISAHKGVIADGTAFMPLDHYEIEEDAKKYGLRPNCRSRLFNGMTGDYMDSAIYIVPTFMQKLQKYVLDDEQSVSGTGPTDAITGQPLGGKKLAGGIRMGEMEVSNLVVHGVMKNLNEKLMNDSDGRTLYICRGCSDTAIYNELQDIYKCVRCGEMADIVGVNSTKSAILFREELAAANIGTKLILDPRRF